MRVTTYNPKEVTCALGNHIMSPNTRNCILFFSQSRKRMTSIHSPESIFPPMLQLQLG